MFEESIDKVSATISKQVSIGIVGDVGNDKSSIDTFFIQVTEMNNINNMEKLYFNLRIVLSKFDFNKIDQYFITNFDPEKVYTTEDYLDLAHNCINETDQISIMFDRKDYLKYVNFDPFSKKTYDELLAEYFEITYYLFYRKSHVLSNTSIESVNTGNNSYIMKESLVQMYRKNELALERFLVINEDEKAIIDNSRISSKRDKESIKENEDGKDIWYYIIRHLGMGSIQHFNVNQRIEDVTAFMRRLYQIIIESTYSEIYVLYDLETYLLQTFINLSSKMEKQYIKILKIVNYLNKKIRYDTYIKNLEKYNAYLNRYNRFKRFQRLSYQFMQKLLKTQFKRNIISVHQRIDDVGKDILDDRTKTKSYSLNLLWDVNWVFGKYSTHSFSYIRDIRNAKAKIPLAKAKVFESTKTKEEEFRYMQYKNIDRLLDSLHEIQDINITEDEKTLKSQNNAEIDHDSIEVVSYDQYDD